MKMKNMANRKNTREIAKAKIRKALVLLGTATIMGACGAGTPEGDTARDVGEESILGNQSLRESSIVLTPREDGARLSAEVIVYEPSESTSDPLNIRDVMEQISSACMDSPNVQVCIYEEAIERTGRVRGTILPDAQVQFQYWSAEREEWIELGVGRECDISNHVPSLIRATYLPGIDSEIRTSTAGYRMPSLDSD